MGAAHRAKQPGQEEFRAAMFAARFARSNGLPYLADLPFGTGVHQSVDKVHLQSLIWSAYHRLPAEERSAWFPVSLW